MRSLLVIIERWFFIDEHQSQLDACFLFKPPAKFGRRAAIFLLLVVMNWYIGILGVSNAVARCFAVFNGHRAVRLNSWWDILAIVTEYGIDVRLVALRLAPVGIRRARDAIHLPTIRPLPFDRHSSRVKDSWWSWLPGFTPAIPGRLGLLDSAGLFDRCSLLRRRWVSIIWTGEVWRRCDFQRTGYRLFASLLIFRCRLAF